MQSSGWVRCPKCGKEKAYWMSDSLNMWCVDCKKIVK